MIHWREIGTLAKIEAIREVWFPGCSTAQIAAHFNDVSRNAIIGIYTRYGPTHLADKPLRARSPINKAGAEKRKRLVFRGPTKFKGSKPLPEVVERVVEYRLCGKPLMMLEARECRFPVNEAEGEALHLFCGRPTERSFCDHHHGRVFQPVERR